MGGGGAGSRASGPVVWPCSNRPVGAVASCRNTDAGDTAARCVRQRSQDHPCPDLRPAWDCYRLPVTCRPRTPHDLPTHAATRAPSVTTTAATPCRSVPGVPSPSSRSPGAAGPTGWGDSASASATRATGSCPEGQDAAPRGGYRLPGAPVRHSALVAPGQAPRASARWPSSCCQPSPGAGEHPFGSTKRARTGFVCRSISPGSGVNREPCRVVRVRRTVRDGGGQMSRGGQGLPRS